MFTNRTSVMVKIVMADKDVIETIDRLFPTSKGIRTYRFPNKKDQWVWQIADRDDVRAFVHGVLPYLHSRRKAKAEATIARLWTNPGARSKRTHCIRGHPLSGDNLRITQANGSRHCKTCQRDRDSKRYRKR